MALLGRRVLHFPFVGLSVFRTTIFLRYSHLDVKIMRRLCEDLCRAGFPVWKGLAPGSPSWQRAIRDTLDTARCMGVILSPAAEHMMCRFSP